MWIHFPFPNRMDLCFLVFFLNEDNHYDSIVINYYETFIILLVIGIFRCVVND